MKGELCAAHAVFLRTCMLPLTIFVLANQVCSPYWMALYQMPEHSLTELWIMTTKSVFQQEFSMSTNYKSGMEGNGCARAWTRENALWVHNSQKKLSHKQLETKESGYTAITKTNRKALEATPPWKRSQSANKIPGWLQEPTLTNPNLGQQSLTPTASKTKRKWETPWQRRHTQFARQPELWQKAEDTNQSPPF